jgi:hypothetical protein
MTCLMMCEECQASDDAGPLYHCDYCAKALCYDCRPVKNHQCEEE